VLRDGSGLGRDGTTRSAHALELWRRPDHTVAALARGPDNALAFHPLCHVDVSTTLGGGVAIAWGRIRLVDADLTRTLERS
jgi:hypothetical protein